MTENKIEQLLMRLGLTTLERQCYLALLKRSPQKASELAQKFSVPKATVLLALKRLTDELGIIRRARKKNSYLFLVDEVKDLVDYILREEEKVTQTKRDLYNLLPEMRGIQNWEVAKPKIYYFEGKEGMQKALDQVLEETDEYVVYGSVEDDVTYLPQVYPAYYDKRVAKRIPTKAIVPALPLSLKECIENTIAHQRQTHFVPKDWNFNVQTNFYKNAVVFLSYEEDFALMIKSRPIAACLLKLYELAYEKAGDYDKQIRKDAIDKGIVKPPTNRNTALTAEALTSR